jgi:hypothetical protein
MNGLAVPIGFPSIEDWILEHLYQTPKAAYTTHTLLKELEETLKKEPSRLDEYNKLHGILGAAPLTSEEYELERKPDDKVQRAVENLIHSGLLTGKRDNDADGVVFFAELKLTGKGEREAIGRSRERERQSKPQRSFESTLRDIRERSANEPKNS